MEPSVLLDHFIHGVVFLVRHFLQFLDHLRIGMMLPGCLEDVRPVCRKIDPLEIAGETSGALPPSPVAMIASLSF
jgi:hypothetical protein